MHFQDVRIHTFIHFSAFISSGSLGLHKHQTSYSANIVVMCRCAQLIIYICGECVCVCICYWMCVPWQKSSGDVEYGNDIWWSHFCYICLDLKKTVTYQEFCRFPKMEKWSNGNIPSFICDWHSNSFHHVFLKVQITRYNMILPHKEKMCLVLWKK